MAVQLIVPFRGGCEYRGRAWRWLRARYEAEGWDVVEAAAPEGPWCKGAALLPAVEASAAEIVVIADADVWCDGLEKAVAAVEKGRAWGKPHRKVIRLSEAGADALLTGEDWKAHRPVERPEEGVWGGGIVVMRRDVYLDCPMDDRFRGWGQEDTSWALALKALHKDGFRGKEPLLHLWHPPQPRLDRRKGSEEGWALHSRYRKARDKKDAMRALIDEAKENRCLSSA